METATAPVLSVECLTENRGYGLWEVTVDGLFAGTIEHVGAERTLDPAAYDMWRTTFLDPRDPEGIHGGTVRRHTCTMAKGAGFGDALECVTRHANGTHNRTKGRYL